MSVFSERLNALIKKNGWTQRELAQKIGVTEQAISHYARGRRIPRNDTLVQIAKALGTTTDDLLGASESVSLKRMERIQQNLYKLNPDQLKKAEKLLNAAFDDAFEDQK
ncbi:helix-turn-helix domain-containing protein [Lachnospiraceae bacterium YH-ros2228]